MFFRRQSVPEVITMRMSIHEARRYGLSATVYQLYIFRYYHISRLAHKLYKVTLNQYPPIFYYLITIHGNNTGVYKSNVSLWLINLHL